MEDKRTKKIRAYRIIMLVVLTAIISCMTTSIFMYKKIEDKLQTAETTEQNIMLQKMQMFKSMLNAKYIYDIDEESLKEGALKGYVEGLGDKYTEYLTKEEMDDLKEEVNSEYVGIGVYISNIDDQIYIVGVMPGSPALEAGLKEGDIITKINGKEYNGEKLNDATTELKQKEGTTVQVTYIRDDKENEVTVERRKITVEHVAGQMLENNVAYIQITSFEKGTADSFKEKLEELKNQGATKIIIDVRSNGGGIVDEATRIANMFIDKGETLLITKGKDETEKITKAEEEPIAKDMKIAILTNKSTASASEILAGALKDKKGATLVGTQTYGKGVIQTVYSLGDGSGIKITTEEYFTPNHNKINGEGLTPDYEVKLTKDSSGNYETALDSDTQLLKAEEILKNN